MNLVHLVETIIEKPLSLSEIGKLSKVTLCDLYVMFTRGVGVLYHVLIFNLRSLSKIRTRHWLKLIT